MDIKYIQNVMESGQNVDHCDIKELIESLRTAEQNVREIEDFLVEDYKREYVGQGIEKWLRSACRALLNKLNHKSTEPKYRRVGDIQVAEPSDVLPEFKS